MWRGRCQHGEEITLGVLCTDGAGAPVYPDAAPTLDVFGPEGQPVAGQRLPAVDRAAAVGLFQLGLFLGPAFAPGRHRAVYRWSAGGLAGVAEDWFDLLPGGDARGAVIALYAYERPQADYLIRQQDGGAMGANRNPYY